MLSFRSLRAFAAAIVTAVLAPTLSMAPVAAEFVSSAPLDPLISALAAPGPEVASMRTAASKTYASETAGHFTTRVFAGPVHFKDTDGRWQDIKTDLVTDTTGAIRNAANSFGLELAPLANAGTLGKMTVGPSHSIGFRLQGALPAAGVVSRDEIEYREALPSVTLRLTSRKSGLKEELILTSPLAPRSFVFPLQLQGLSPRLLASGDVVFEDESGAARVLTPAGWMEDANLNPNSGDGAISEGVDYELVQLLGGPALKVTLDDAWLSNPARQYPVTVDPNFTQVLSNRYGYDKDDTYVMSGFTNNYARDDHAHADLPRPAH